MRRGKRMNYEIINNTGFTFSIIETATNQIIYTYNFLCDAKKMLNHLNSGGGFDGITPNFFLKNIKKS